MGNTENDRLRALNAELLAALEELKRIRHLCFIPNDGNWLDYKINAAIAKAKGETNVQIP